MGVVFDTFKNTEYAAKHRDVSVYVNDGKKNLDDLRNKFEGWYVYYVVVVVRSSGGNLKNKVVGVGAFFDGFSFFLLPSPLLSSSPQVGLDNRS